MLSEVGVLGISNDPSVAVEGAEEVEDPSRIILARCGMLGELLGVGWGLDEGEPKRLTTEKRDDFFRALTEGVEAAGVLVDPMSSLKDRSKAGAADSVERVRTRSESDNISAVVEEETSKEERGNDGSSGGSNMMERLRDPR